MGSDNALSDKLGVLLNKPPISIDSLPGDPSLWLADAPSEHSPFLFVDQNLGVPQKLAYKAFMDAIPRFRRVRTLLSPYRMHITPQTIANSDIQELISTSAILLFVNPAHQSALNVRKRLIYHGSLAPAHELKFTDALLTLREGAKQSILWHYRRWLLRRIHPPHPDLAPPSSHARPGDDGDTLGATALPPSAFRAEFAAVERACELYPRNYHAWAHRAACLDALVASLRCAPSRALGEVLAEERARARVWVERHVADYSGAQYVCRLERALVDAGLADTLAGEMVCSAAEGERGAHGDEVAAHALGLVRAYPMHEALWLYLRGALGLAAAGDAEGEARGVAEGVLVRGANEAARGAWAHAVRFLAWTFREDKAIGINAAVVRRVAAVAERDVAVSSAAELLNALRHQ